MGDRNAPSPRGRPKGSKSRLSSKEKVYNPLTNRNIIKNGRPFKELLKRYKYDANKNEFVTHVKDPKNENILIAINNNDFNRYIGKGYIYNRLDNILIPSSRKSENAFQNAITTYDLTIVNEIDPVDQMNKLNKRIEVLIKKRLNKLNGIKFYVGMDIIFSKPNPNGENIITEVFYMPGKAITITHESNISEAIQAQREKINREIERFTKGGSELSIEQIRRHHLTITEYKPLAGKSYIPLPACIQNKKATINIQNDDDKCFMYCLGRALDPNPEKKNLERVSNHLKNICEELGLNKICMPVSVPNISKTERQFNISINLFGHNGGQIYSIKVTKEVDKKHINLLYTENDDKKHYVFIRDFDKLCCNINKTKHKQHFCYYCLQHFTTTEIL